MNKKILNRLLLSTVISISAVEMKGTPAHAAAAATAPAETTHTNFLEVYLRGIEKKGKVRRPDDSEKIMTFQNATQEGRKGFPDQWDIKKIEAFQWLVKRFEVIYPFVALEGPATKEKPFVLDESLVDYFGPALKLFKGHQSPERLKELVGPAVNIGDAAEKGMWTLLPKEVAENFSQISNRAKDGTLTAADKATVE